jgi:ABC-type transport system involved in multi-copper enzyme maturation permease subunit
VNLHFPVSIIINPILQREVRGRWRDNRSLWMAGALALALNGWALFDLARPFSSGQNLAQRAHDLFGNLHLLQTLLIMMLAPALTATSIALERERGLLEGLQISALRPWQIIGGKWGGALLFALTIWLVTLPIIALCHAFGGINGSEWRDAAALQVATLICCTAIGICCSAWSSRAAIGLRISYGLTMFWGLSGFVAMISLWWPKWPTALKTLLTFFVQINPALVARSFHNPVLESSLIIAAAPWEMSPASFCAGFSLLLTFLLLGAAMVAVRRPLEEARWIELPGRESRPAKAPEAATNYQLRDVGLTQWIERLTAFANPVLTHETRGKLRMRQPPLSVIIIELLMAGCVLTIYLSLLFASFFQPTGSGLSRFLGGAGGVQLSLRETIWRVLSWVAFLVLVPAGALMGATAIVRERESGAWESLKLSLLSSGEILWGKIGGVLWACAVFSLPLWPLLLPGVRALEYEPFLSNPSDVRNGVPLTLALAITSILFASVFGATLLGLWIAWPCRRSDIAGGRAFALLILLLGALPLIAPRAETLHLDWWHPGWVLWTLEQEYRSGTPIFGRVAPVVAIWLILGVAAWLASWWRLRQEMRR